MYCSLDNVDSIIAEYLDTKEEIARDDDTRMAIKKYNYHFSEISPKTRLLLALAFPEEFGSHFEPPKDEFPSIVCAYKRLTPQDYGRDIFHITLSVGSTNYEVGDAIGIRAQNCIRRVNDFLSKYKLDGGEIVSWGVDTNEMATTTIRRCLIHFLDIFGPVNKKFYTYLSKKCTSRYEKLRLAHLGTDDKEGAKVNKTYARTFANILLQFGSATLSPQEIVDNIPKIKARHYSIASSSKNTPGFVDLLVSKVVWKTPDGKRNNGQCSSFLSKLRPGEKVSVSFMKSILKLPNDSRIPVIMAGLGTGMAPFRAFIKELSYRRDIGLSVGQATLFFGARHEATEFLYGSELRNYEKEGWLDLKLAFSRDQKRKIYIQHKIKEYGEDVRRILEDEGGYFYLCGPTWPVNDIKKALTDAGVDVERMKKEGRYMIEVY